MRVKAQSNKQQIIVITRCFNMGLWSSQTFAHITKMITVLPFHRYLHELISYLVMSYNKISLAMDMYYTQLYIQFHPITYCINKLVDMKSIYSILFWHGSYPSHMCYHFQNPLCQEEKIDTTDNCHIFPHKYFSFFFKVHAMCLKFNKWINVYLNL